MVNRFYITLKNTLYIFSRFITMKMYHDYKDISSIQKNILKRVGREVPGGLVMTPGFH